MITAIHTRQHCCILYLGLTVLYVCRTGSPLCMTDNSPLYGTDCPVDRTGSPVDW